MSPELWLALLFVLLLIKFVLLLTPHDSIRREPLTGVCLKEPPAGVSLHDSLWNPNQCTDSILHFNCVDTQYFSLLKGQNAWNNLCLGSKERHSVSPRKYPFKNRQQGQFCWPPLLEMGLLIILGVTFGSWALIKANLKGACESLPWAICSDFMPRSQCNSTWMH